MQHVRLAEVAEKPSVGYLPGPGPGEDLSGTLARQVAGITAPKPSGSRRKRRAVSGNKLLYQVDFRAIAMINEERYTSRTLKKL